MSDKTINSKGTFNSDQTFNPGYSGEVDDEFGLVHTRHLPRLGALGISGEETITREITQQEIKE